jgi:uncharacterized protein YbjT (DUF2867 family)
MNENQSMKVAVAGGTGTVGHHVVAALEASGHEAVVLSRRTGVDLMTGDGLDAALAGADAVVDVTSTPTMSSRRSRDFFTTVTSRLLAAEQRAGVRHHVALSVVGADRGRTGHYAGKLAQERLVEAGPVPWTILRATQFHEFASQVHAGMTAGPWHLAPRMRTQPVAASEVGARLAELATGAPAGRARELAGPHEAWLPDLVRAWDRAVGGSGHVLGVPLPGVLGRAMRRGWLLPGPDADRGRQTFGQWLEQARPARTRA